MPAPTVRVVDQPPPRADLVIVGGGVIGCATAFFASRAGLRVLVLDRRAALATLTTPVSAGAFRLQFDNPEEIGLVREGIGLFDAFAERTGLDGWDLGVRHAGYLFCSLTDATLERSRALVARQREWGLTDVELLTGDEARARWPWLSPEVRGARFRADDGWLDPKRLAIGYAVAASNASSIPDGVVGGSTAFCLETDAIGFDLTPDGSRLRGLHTSRGEIETDALVLAAGPFLGVLASLAGVSLAVSPTRRQKLVVPELPEVPSDAPMTIDEETAAHWRPALHGCLGLFTEAQTPSSEPADPVPIAQEWAFGLLDPASDHALARVAPFWRSVWNDGAPVAHWLLQAGQYEVTPDRRPFLGATGVEGLWVNGGYSGHGIMAGAAGSRLVINLLTGQVDGTSNSFRPDRVIESRKHDIL
ncbi:MAG: NAD(P)/FAD-dependent oxidoreductase [Candidatus Limnocylindria bacterium]